MEGHGPGEGCDFCDARRLGRGEVVGGIEEEKEGYDGTGDEGGGGGGGGEGRFSISETVRGVEEARIIDDYARASTVITTSVYASSEEEERMRYSATTVGGSNDEVEVTERAKRASDWARSYEVLVGRAPGAESQVQLWRFVGGGRGCERCGGVVLGGMIGCV